MVAAQCTACGTAFAAAESMRGGYANCPRCGRATQVPGGPEPLFWGLLAGGVLVTLAAAIALFVAVHPAAGIGALVVGSAIIAISVFAS